MLKREHMVCSRWTVDLTDTSGVLPPCSIPRVDVDFGLCLPGDTAALPSPKREAFYYRPEEEIAYGPAAWLWDYLRRR
jgi:hypothetical protein